MKILTAAEMQRIDRITTERYGVPSLTLMENAGRGVVEFLQERHSPLDRHKIAIVCGRGNNGGDGLVVARLLRERGLSPRVVLCAEPDAVKGDAAVNLGRLSVSGPPELAANVEAWRRLRPSLEGTSLVVDALLGTGLARSLEGFLLEVVRDLNRDCSGAQVVAVDLPSGLSADSGELIGECVRANASVTFTAAKLAHVFPPACERVGEWTVKQIGTPPEALDQDPELRLSLTTARDVAWVAEPRRPGSHKGNFGHVLVVAGSVGKTGAAALAAKAALRSGAGLVTVATPKSAQPVVAALGMEYMTVPLPETDSGTISLRAFDDGAFEELVAGKSVIAIGPGIGIQIETSQLARSVENRYTIPLVLDADGLNAFAGHLGDFQGRGRVRVLTPHPGEMARLAGMTTAEVQSRRLEVAREFATNHGIWLALKGFRTLVASPDGAIRVNPTGNPGMATGGTGDVLTGIVAGLLAQHPTRPVEEVVAAAVYLHGLAGDIAAEEHGETSLIAGDLLETLPRAFGRVGQAKTADKPRQAV